MALAECCRADTFSVMRCHVGAIAVCTLLLAGTAVRSGTIRTIDGKNYEGDVRLEEGRVVMTPKRGAAVKLELSDLILGNFRNTDASRPAPAANSAAGGGGGGALDRVWKMRDVGPTGTPGSARLI